MNDLISIYAVVHGRVQGVYFRAFVSEKANELGLCGFVRNLPDGESVAVHAEGEKKQLEILIGHLKMGPRSARVEKVDIEWSEYSGNHPRFSINY
jgi:acylphosphatase